MTSSLPHDPGELAREVLRIEARAIADLALRIDASFLRAVELLYGCNGRVVVTGMGKSGIIGKKIAATLASTGTPALFLHAAEAVHGDLGMLVPGDVVLAVSGSGETGEILRVLETIRRIGATLVALTGSPASTLARNAECVLDASIGREACPLDLAPTASTTALLAMGDALAMAVMQRRGFTAEEFAARHPGGTLGRKLVRVATLMHVGDAMPRVAPSAPLADALKEISAKRFGAALVVDDKGTLAGVITDGDLRRLMQRLERPLQCRVEEAMTRTPTTIGPDELAAAALRLLEERRITSLPVVDADRRVLGFLHLHDLWRTQMF